MSLAAHIRRQFKHHTETVQSIVDKMTDEELIAAWKQDWQRKQQRLASAKTDAKFTELVSKCERKVK